MVKRQRALSRGFTLLELMIVIAIIAIAVSISMPSFSKMIANMRQKGASAELFAAVVRARSEAIRLNSAVTITPVSGIL